MDKRRLEEPCRERTLNTDVHASPTGARLHPRPHRHGSAVGALQGCALVRRASFRAYPVVTHTRDM